MDVTLDCKVILSNKLRKLLNNNSVKIILTSTNTEDGKANATLTFNSSDDLNITNDGLEKLGETSLIIVPNKISQGISTDNFRVTNLFSSQNFGNDLSQGKSERNAVDKMAVTEAPLQDEVPNSVVKEEEIETPEEFKELDVPECKNWISNMTELIEAASKSKSQTRSESGQQIDLTMARNEREKAVLKEQMEKQNGIDEPAWIVNDKTGMITINDLKIDLPINSPFNLANISSNKLMQSQDLKTLASQGFIKFIQPEEVGNYISNFQTEAETIGEYEVFDGPDQAKANMFDDNDNNDNTEEEITDVEEKFEEEKMILDLTQSMSNKANTSNNSKNISNDSQGALHRRTSHGNRPTQASTTNSNNSKPIEHKTVKRSS